MIDAQAVINYLVSKGLSFTTIDHAWTMEPVDKLDVPTPMLLVYPGQVGAQPSQFALRVIQDGSEQTVFLIICKSAELKSLEEELRLAFLGYEMSEHHSGMEFVGGAPEGIRGQYIWWKCTFQTQLQYRAI